jgi:hypothetical protein
VGASTTEDIRKEYGVPATLPPTPAPGDDEDNNDSRSQTTSQSNEDRSGQSTRHRLEAPSTSRFVGDLSPEAVFLSHGGPQSKRHQSDQYRVGVWLANKTDSIKKNEHGSLQDNPNTLNCSQFSPPVLQAFRPYLENECLSTVPPPAEANTLIAIYLSKFHPIIPILNIVGFNNMRDKGPESIMLTQAICLVASKDMSATDSLILPGHSSTLPHREFAGKLFAAIKTSLSIGIADRDKVVQIQILALLSLHSEGADGGVESSMQLAQAIHHAQTIGLHLGRSMNDQNNEYLARLFCCLWALDKLNAGLNGRPIMIQDRDVGIDINACFEKQSPEFGIFLQVAKILDKVIELYRPSADSSITGWEEDFPGFEELVIQSHGREVFPLLLGT